MLEVEALYLRGCCKRREMRTRLFVPEEEGEVEEMFV